MYIEVLAHFNTLERRVLEDAMVALGILFSDTGEPELEAGVVSRVRARRTTRETTHMPPRCATRRRHFAASSRTAHASSA
jgi:hypothetical protein